MLGGKCPCCSRYSVMVNSKTLFTQWALVYRFLGKIWTRMARMWSLIDHRSRKDHNLACVFRGNWLPEMSNRQIVQSTEGKKECVKTKEGVVTTILTDQTLLCLNIPWYITFYITQITPLAHFEKCNQLFLHYSGIRDDYIIFQELTYSWGSTFNNFHSSKSMLRYCLYHKFQCWCNSHYFKKIPSPTP